MKKSEIIFHPLALPSGSNPANDNIRIKQKKSNKSKSKKNADQQSTAIQIEVEEMVTWYRQEFLLSFC